MGAAEDLLVLFPAEHTGADPSDFQHVSDEVLENAMASIHAAWLCPKCGRNAHQISALALSEDTELWLQLAPPVTPYKVTRAQWKPGASAHSTARDLGDRTAQHNFFTNADGAGTPCSDGFPLHVEGNVMEPSEFTDLASTPGEPIAEEGVFRN